MNEFTDLINLASERLGTTVVAANDEFFAPKERLVLDDAPVFIDGRYTERGKWMDGWETRRRREPGDDWCIVRLGLPGVIHGVLVDTAHFKGNYPEACLIDATAIGGYPTAADLIDPSVAWYNLLPRTPLAGDTQNRFPVSSDRRWTHVRFRIFPDGGVARLRIYGRAQPEWDARSHQREFDLAAVEHGGLVVAASDMFFGSRNNLIMPGAARGMSDGWETRRRRGPGHDWVIIELGRSGLLNRVEIDTTHFKGNAPGSCSLDATEARSESTAEVLVHGHPWRTVLPMTNLLPDTRHFFELNDAGQGPCSHVRFNIFPDGGVGRLRVMGIPE